MNFFQGFITLFIFIQPVQEKILKVSGNIPKQIKAGSKIELPITIIHQFKEENTGTISVELINPKTHTSVDGWFLNVFPYQYFTSIPNKKFSTTFPITVPSDFSGLFMIVVKAHCKNQKDSVAYSILVPKKNTRK